MARIRSIKPDFWTDEKVVEVSAFARLLFIGLWNLADDEGRLEYSPKRIKMQIFPADSLDVSELIGELLREKLIEVYEVENKEYLNIPGMAKHQKIDKRAPSKLPPPPSSPESPRIPPNPPLGKEGKGKERSMGASSGDDGTESANEPEVSKPDVSSHADKFETFWKVYPSRAGRPNPKKPARQKFLRLASGEADGAIEGARRYADRVKAEKVDPEYVAQAVTFLNQERWRDELEAKPKRKSLCQG